MIQQFTSVLGRTQSVGQNFLVRKWSTPVPRDKMAMYQKCSMSFYGVGSTPKRMLLCLRPDELLNHQKKLFYKLIAYGKSMMANTITKKWTTKQKTFVL